MPAPKEIASTAGRSKEAGIRRGGEKVGSLTFSELLGPAEPGGLNYERVIKVTLEASTRLLFLSMMLRTILV